MSEEADSAPETEQAEDAGSGEGDSDPKAKPRSSEVASFKDLDIACGTPLPEYDSGPAKAYQAVGKDRGGAANYFALVCEPHLVPRLNSASVYQSVANPGLAPLVDSGVVYWPPAGAQRYVLIYRDVLAKRLLWEKDKQAMDWRQDDVMNIVLNPMIGVLQDMRDRDFVHGSIRPSNMFSGVTSGKPERVILGDCLGLPDSYSQPALYETIQRAMVSPVGRGPAIMPDDMYAFGVTIAVFLRSTDPLQDMDDDEIIKAKIEHGSYTTITGKDRFKGSILELLRGLLIDDPVERWTMEEVLSWTDGLRLSPKQSVKQKKASRPIVFNEKKYSYPSFLAMDIDTNPQETLRVVENDDLQQWMMRSLDDAEALERLEHAIKLSQEKGTGPGYEERLAFNISTALDPNAPIRYKGLRLMGEGIGKAMAEAMVLGKEIKPFADIFLQGIALNWVTVQQNSHMDVSALISRFDNCRNFARQTKLGYGIERCLYFLSPEAHCLSQKLDGYFVRSPEDMLMAFEDICNKGKAPLLFLDRHSAAFLCVKDAKVIDTCLFELSSPEDHKQLLGNLKCFANIQKRSKMPPLKGLAAALEERLVSVYTRFHDRDTRDKMQRSVKRFAAEGDLIKMSALLSNTDVSSKDLSAFRAAMHEYSELTHEYEALDARLAEKETFGKHTGKEMAAVVSSIFSALSILAVIIMSLTSTPNF